MKQTPRGSIVAAFFVVMILTIASSAAQAFWTLDTYFDIDMDGKDDVHAQSKFTKEALSQRADIYDTVRVLQDAPANLTKLPFEWHIDQGHRFKGTLPWAGSWRATNHWYTYRYPFHADFSLDLDPQGTGVAPYTVTAEAHQPHLVLDKILGLLTASVGGSYGQGDIDDMEDTFVASISVWATFEENGTGYTYEYWAQNHTGGSAHLDWWAYGDPNITDEFPDATFTDISLAPGETKKLGMYSSMIEPAETNGRVTALFGGETYVFFAPTIVPVPEPTSMAVMALGLSLLGGRLLKRMR